MASCRHDDLLVVTKRWLCGNLNLNSSVASQKRRFSIFDNWNTHTDFHTIKRHFSSQLTLVSIFLYIYNSELISVFRFYVFYVLTLNSKSCMIKWFRCYSIHVSTIIFQGIKKIGFHQKSQILSSASLSISRTANFKNHCTAKCW